MNRTHLRAAVLLAAGLAASARAGAQEGPGLIGRSWYGAALTAEHLDRGSFANGYGATATANLNVLAGLDLAIAGAGARFSRTPDGGRTPKTVSLTAVNYSDADYGKSYWSATVGRSWDYAGLRGAGTAGDDSYWELGTGIEVAYGRATAVNYGVGFSDSFGRNGRHSTWRFGATLHHWVARRTAVVLGFAYNRVKHAPDSLVYVVGVRVLF